MAAAGLDDVLTARHVGVCISKRLTERYPATTVENLFYVTVVIVVHTTWFSREIAQVTTAILNFTRITYTCVYIYMRIIQCLANRNDVARFHVEHSCKTFMFYSTRTQYTSYVCTVFRATS